MSTIINSIALQNFYNYYGDYESNIYEFNTGLNVIVADNGAGKSKLFNAFLWIITDRILDSDDKRRYSIAQAKVKMISAKTRNETAIGEEIKCGVKIHFSDDQFEYLIEKAIYATRLSNDSISDDATWECDIREADIAKKDKILLDFKPVYDQNEKEEIVRKIIRPEFLKYALLQGEEVDQILDFNDNKSLKDAIDTLSNIGMVDRLIEVAKYLSDKAFSDLSKEKKQQVTDKAAFQKKEDEYRKTATEIERREKELSNSRANLHKAKEERDSLISYISSAEERQEIRNRRANIIAEFTKQEQQHGSFLNNLNDNFFDERSAWLLLETSAYSKHFIKLRESYLDKRKEKQLLNEIKNGNSSFLTKLPEGSPDSYSLSQMLDKEACFVCGREAKKNTDSWRHINNVLQAHKGRQTSSLETKQNFTSLLDDLMTRSQSFHNQVGRIWEDISKQKNRDVDYKREKAELQKQAEALKNSLSALGGSEENNDKDKINQFGQAERRIEKYENEIKLAEKNIELASTALFQIKEDLNRLSANSTIAQGYLIREEVTEDINKIASNTRERLFDRIIAELETEANKYFKELTVENNIKGGQIRIKREGTDSFSIEIRDGEDNKIYGLSEGFQRMKKLAVIMAIITTSKRGKMDYPLIADAPVSTFGKGFIKGFFNKVPEVFSQSIVMVKDLYDENSVSLLNDVGEMVLEKIRQQPGSFHLNEITGWEAENSELNEKPDQTKIQTKIKRY